LRVGQLAAVNLRLPGGERVDARFADQLAAMAAARDEGLIAGVGLCNVGLEQLRHAVAETGIVCMQNLFHLAFCANLPSCVCPALADHHDPVMTDHLPSGKPEPAAKIRAARLRRST
jgi:diketogulonate reductase-like aldo/keto reductase